MYRPVSHSWRVDSNPWRSPLLLWPVLLCACLAMISVPGCGGCSSDPVTQKKKEEAERTRREEELRKKKKKKPDFEIGQVTIQPSAGKNPNRFVKPGHWVGAIQAMKTNNFDFVGELETAVVDKNGRPFDLDRTPFRLTTARPAALPKGQKKYLDMTFFVPHSIRAADVSSVLRGRGSGSEIKRGGRTFSLMQPHQYYFVVLSSTPESYSFIQDLPSVTAPYNELSMTDFTDVTRNGDQMLLYYRVVAPRLRKPMPLPVHALTWTSIAYVLWDDVDPDLLSVEQQQALLDWIHWGGQLLVSGPNSLEALRGSFLDPFLPAQAGEARVINTDDLEEINQRWTLKPHAALTALKPWSGIDLKKHERASPVEGTAGLLLERFVGRGRIVVSATRLTQRDLRIWKGFDGFFNACLLRRPRRTYKDTEVGMQLGWSDYSGRPNKPSHITALRYFSRDTGNRYQRATSIRQAYDQLGQEQDQEVILEATARGGVAGWNPMSATSEAARSELRKAAGIVVPKSSFVVWSLALYLVVLVPLNWTVFYVIGRVEWAWVAAPVIAVIFSLLVIRFAQLDIGFASSHTEIAVLETQGDYPRGHLTRFTALYSSLSTTYDIHFDTLEAVAQPFPVDREFRMITGQERTTVTYRRATDVSLEGIRVASNTTGMVHSEQMIDLGGSIRLSRASTGQMQVYNATPYTLSEVGVIRRRVDSDGKSVNEACWIGEIGSRHAGSIGFKAVGGQRPFAEQRKRDANDDSQRRLKIDQLYALAENWKYLPVGEIRLVGRIDQLIPGQRLDPDVSQVRAAALLVAHLAPPDRKDPQPDLNTRASLRVRKLDDE